jgi:hypothetical protein
MKSERGEEMRKWLMSNWLTSLKSWRKSTRSRMMHLTYRLKISLKTLLWTL